MTPKKVGALTDFINDFNGDFIYINCEIFPITSFMYRDRKILKQEPVYELLNYVETMVNKLGVPKLNLDILERCEADTLELIITEKGIEKISLKGEHYATK